jgi:hypothetical protein
MGVVYKARDLELGRDVAIKILHERYTADGPDARQFLEEARIAAQLVHPNIVTIHEVGALPDGRPFLVMKFVKGATLDVLLAERAERGRLLAIYEQLCAAVAYAHERGVIHRDLKPSNVMVGPFGEVQVMDWGLAKMWSGAASGLRAEDTNTSEAPRAPPRTEIRARHPDATADGRVMGTPGYMSPEQAGGEVAKIDRRADVFSLGGVLCTILTGRAPYTGDRATEIHLKAVRAETTDAFAALDACGADPALVSLCKRCLSASRDDRPADAGELARAVQSILAARSAPPARRAAESARPRAARGWTRRAALLGLPAVAATAAGGYFVLRDRGDPPGGVSSPPPPPPLPPPAPEPVLVPVRQAGGQVGDVAVSGDGRWLAVALTDWNPPLKAGGVKLFDRSRGAAPEVWWKWRDVACRGVAFSPDGALLAAAAGDSLRVVSLAHGQEVAFPEAGAGLARAVGFSPDGKFLTLGINRPLGTDQSPQPGFARAWGVAARAKGRDFERPNLPLRCVAYSADGTLLAVGFGVRADALTSGVELWNAATGGHVAHIDAPLSVRGPHVAFARSAPLCAVTDQNSVRFYEPPGTEPLKQEFVTDGAGEPSALALRPDGAVVAFALEGLIHLGEVKTSILFATRETHAKEVSSLAFTADGRMLIAGTYDGTVHEWPAPAPK